MPEKKPDIRQILEGYTLEELSDAVGGEESILGCILHQICVGRNFREQIRLFRQLKKERLEIFKQLPSAEQSVFPPGKTPLSFKIIYKAEKRQTCP